jgi:hypothetical protein
MVGWSMVGWSMVRWSNGWVVQWLGGQWLSGRWLGGQWLSGRWLGGQWLSGRWLGGPMVGFLPQKTSLVGGIREERTELHSSHLRRVLVVFLSTYHWKIL